MSWALIILGVLTAAGGWWWFYQSKKPYYHRNLKSDRFAWLLKGLADTMRQESVLMIEHQGSDRFIQFIKSGSPSGECLGFAFPDAPWSRNYFDPLVAALSKEGFAVAVSETGDDQVPRFIEVELHGSQADQIDLALRVAETARQVMSLGKDELFTAHFRGELDSKSVIEQSLRGIREARRHAAGG